MTTESVNSLLMEFQILWNEALMGNYQNGQKIKELAKQIKEATKDPVVRASLNPTEQQFHANAMVIANL